VRLATNRVFARITTLAVVALLLTGCGGAPILANPPLTFPSPATTASPPPRPADPIPLAFPRDDGPHDRLTEWWYYTGHLLTDEGRRFGFEAVVFRAERSSVPTAWASHLALTDERNGRFYYAQRSEVGPQVDQSPRGASGEPTGFGLRIGGLSPVLVADGAAPLAEPWRFTGANGRDAIEARLASAEGLAAGATFGLDLQLSDHGDPVPHDNDGFVEFGPAGSSYYYSRPRMSAQGTVDLDGSTYDVEGIAWFDHQWGDFVSVGGGWDWFALNLDPVFDASGRELASARDITLSVVRDADGAPVLIYGTVVEAGREPVRVDAAEIEVRSLGSWTSLHTGRPWPSGWLLTIGDLSIRLVPTVQDQELDTRATTGVAYWEGSQLVSGTWEGQTIGGEAYVELTRYSN
jgi:predicted secreted hydrolase